ncbi:hypothetical protein AVEN_151241-1 [Araneus ventricosus]|uniref:Uncharacterized protein n=1 Tax=Araneus ventricosus TaxID=182803 RepID=A0A4Y2V2X7_ARAVE|nr:hypothetical protein AVEN_151241-1 [Araneus ventricosus]
MQISPDYGQFGLVGRPILAEFPNGFNLQKAMTSCSLPLKMFLILLWYNELKIWYLVPLIQISKRGYQYEALIHFLFDTVQLTANSLQLILPGIPNELKVFSLNR